MTTDNTFDPKRDPLSHMEEPLAELKKLMAMMEAGAEDDEISLQAYFVTASCSKAATALSIELAMRRDPPVNEPPTEQLE